MSSETKSRAGLVAKWRAYAGLDLKPSNEKLSLKAKLPGIALTYGAQATYTKCADELEALESSSSADTGGREAPMCSRCGKPQTPSWTCEPCIDEIGRKVNAEAQAEIANESASLARSADPGTTGAHGRRARFCPLCGEDYNALTCDLCHVSTVATGGEFNADYWLAKPKEYIVEQFRLVVEQCAELNDDIEEQSRLREAAERGTTGAEGPAAVITRGDGCSKCGYAHIALDAYGIEKGVGGHYDVPYRIGILGERLAEAEAAATQRAQVTPPAQQFEALREFVLKRCKANPPCCKRGIAPFVDWPLCDNCIRDTVELSKLAAPAPVTTPGRDAVEALIKKWRGPSWSGLQSDEVNRERQLVKQRCADELEEALAAAKEPRG